MSAATFCSVAENDMSTTTFQTALSALKAHREKLFPFDMRAAFAADTGRFAKFSAQQEDLLFD